MKLIDADTFSQQVAITALKEKYPVSKANAMIQLINMQQSVYLDTVECKNCGEIAVMPDGADYRYCPYCGQRY